MNTRNLSLMSGLILCGAVAAYLFLSSNSHRTTGSASSRDSSPSGGGSAPLDRQTTERFLGIEAEAKRLDETVWARELQSQQYEQVFIRLWDDLRKQPDPWSVLENFRVGTIRYGTSGDPQHLDDSIKQTVYTEPLRQLDAIGWRQLLGDFRTEGYRIEQSEWRQARFETNEPPRSIVAMSLHVLHPSTQRRFILRGNLHVKWKSRSGANELSSARASAPQRAHLSGTSSVGDLESPGNDQSPFPEQIEARDLELVERSGETPFEEVLAKHVSPKDNPVFVDPLIAYDLNGDGRDEIILACANLVYWNHENGTFKADALCEAPTETLNAAIIADFNGDALPDLLGADHEGIILYPGDGVGKFRGFGKRSAIAETPLPNPFVMTAGDIDNDGDLDIWLAQYKLPYVAGQMPTPYFDANDGFPSFLLVNDGRGQFRDQTEAAGLAEKRWRRTYSSSFVDLDSDKDLDLVVVSDFAGVDLYQNNGRGHFTDVTTGWVDESRSFGMAHSLADYDVDGRLDLLVIGMNSFVADRLDWMQAGPKDRPTLQEMRPKMAAGNRLYFARDGFFKQTEMSRSAARSGWSWGVTSADFDNDGDVDLYIANGHKSRATAQEYETQFWRHDIYVASSSHDEALNAYFQSVASRLYGAGHSYGGYQKNCLFLNHEGKSFAETGYLMGVAMETDSRNVASADLDGDGRMELLVTTYEEWPRPQQRLHVFRNRFDSRGNWIGFRLREHGPGFSPCGAKVTVVSDRGKQIRHLVTGDSYRSQHSTAAHFGLGRDERVSLAEIHWPNGKTQRWLNPAINQYHNVPPPPPSDAP